MSILNRQHILAFEEEPTFGNRPATPLSNPVYVRPIEGTVNERQNALTLENANGARWASRKEVVAKNFEFSIQLEVHPKLIGWFLKWGLGSQIVNTTTGIFTYSPVEIGRQLKSFSIYVDAQQADLWGQGEETFLLLGCKIGRLIIEGDMTAEDQKVRITIEGIGQKPNVDTSDVITGLARLRYARTLLYNNADPGTFIAKTTAVLRAGIGSQKWQRFGIEINNQLIPRTYADGQTVPYIDDILLGTQTFGFTFDKDFVNAVYDIDDFHNATDRKFDLSITHAKNRAAGTDPYEIHFRFLRANIDEADPLMNFGGGDDVAVRSFTAGALESTPQTEVDTAATGTDHTLDVDTSFVLGTSGDAEAVTFSTPASFTGHGYLTGCRIRLKTDATGATEDLYARIWTDDGGSPSEPVAGTSGPVDGSLSNVFSTESLNTAYQAVYFKFPDHPKLSANTKYWFGVYTTGSGSGVIQAEGNTTGTNTHSVTTDGGTTWGTPDGDRWDLELYFDEIPLSVELEVETGTDFFPDAV